MDDIFDTDAREDRFDLKSVDSKGFALNIDKDLGLDPRYSDVKEVIISETSRYDTRETFYD